MELIILVVNKALTTALMVFSTALATATFGLLIDQGHSMESIAQIYATLYCCISDYYCLIFRKKLEPVLAIKYA